MRRFQEVIGLDKDFNDLKDDHEFFASIVQATESTFFNRTLLALTFFSVIACVSAVLALFGDNLHQASMRAAVLGAASVFFGAVTYLLLRRSGLTWRKR
jgi:membrane associated rhomboid family serine protease